MKHRKASLGKRLQWRLECAAFLVAERLLVLVPLATLWKAGAALSGLARLFASRWPTVRNNLRTVLGPEATRDDLEALTRDVFRHTAANLLTALKGAHMSLDQIREVLTIDNPEIGERALARKKGVLLLVGHMGNWEFLAQAMPAFRPEIRMANIYRPLNNLYLDRILRERREKNGMTMFAKLTSFHRPIRFLEDHAILTLLVDQRAGRAGTLTPFFGRLMSMSPLPEFIHRRTGVPVLGVSMRTTAPGRWTLRFHEPPVEPGESFTTAHMAILMENVIRDSVADEFWMQDLWRLNKRRPLEIRGKIGPIRLARHRDHPLFPFSVLVRVPDDPAHFAETVPALAALAASRPDFELHLLAREDLRALAASSLLPHLFHPLDDPALPGRLQLAIVLTDREIAARDLARRFNGPIYSFPEVAQSGSQWHPITANQSLPPSQRWFEALRSLGMHDPKLEWEYV